MHATAAAFRSAARKGANSQSLKGLKSVQPAQGHSSFGANMIGGFDCKDHLQEDPIILRTTKSNQKLVGGVSKKNGQSSQTIVDHKLNSDVVKGMLKDSEGNLSQHLQRSFDLSRSQKPDSFTDAISDAASHKGDFEGMMQRFEEKLSKELGLFAISAKESVLKSTLQTVIDSGSDKEYLKELIEKLGTQSGHELGVSLKSATKSGDDTPPTAAASSSTGKKGKGAKKARKSTNDQISPITGVKKYSGPPFTPKLTAHETEKLELYMRQVDSGKRDFY